MFSVQQKRDIADAVQKILRETNHPELPQGEIPFRLHVDGEPAWSWADIQNNGSVTNPGVNPHNERVAAVHQGMNLHVIEPTAPGPIRAMQGAADRDDSPSKTNSKTWPDTTEDFQHD
jgi:hypothetical protein